MARPSRFDRKEAIGKAMQEIWRNGYEQTSVKAMSESLGITRSSYYNAFGSREHLFREALSAYAEQSPDRPLREDVADEPVLQLLTRTIREICHERMQDADKRGCMIINCLSELASKNDELGPLMSDTVLACATRFEELLRLAVDRGELAQGTDTKGLSLALQNLLVGLNVFAKALEDESDLWLAVRTTLEGLGVYREP